MDTYGLVQREGFRVWIVRHDRNWRPNQWSDVPPRAVALEPADESCMTAEDVALFVEGFNREMLSERRDRWAVAVPVSIRYEGDLRRGQSVPPADSEPL